MLVLHSSSRCDVCLSEYSWETSSKSPHAIPCGHIFCRDCLYANNPPLCPLCRKLYQPNKMKKLHVDKPDDIDDYKEVDLLQRLVISWETPPEQLHEITTEVDSWLGNRADDSCISLRRARAVLEKYHILKDAEVTLLDNIQSLREERDRLNGAIFEEQAHMRSATEKHLKDINEMTSKITRLTLEVRRLQHATTHRHTHNPLPPPPEPISTDYIPSFEQALTESGSTSRFVDLPSSPRYPAFEVESRSRKGKGRSDRRQEYNDQAYHASPTPQPFSSNSSNHYVQPHVSRLYDSEQYPSQSSRPSLHVGNTNQPLDIYTITSEALKPYTQAYVRGFDIATAGRLRPTTADRYYQPQSSSTHRPTQYESSYRAPSPNVYENQPYSAPVIGASSSRSTRHRQTTMESSIISSASSHGDHGSSPRSRSRSRTREPSNATQDRGIAGLPAPVLFSDPVLSNRPGSPSSRHSTGAAVTFNPVPETYQSQHNSPLPNASNAASNPSASNPPVSEQRYSPSIRSRQTLESGGSWGTPTPSHLASGSLIEGLTSFREGTMPVFEGGAQAITTFRPLDSDGVSIRTHQSRNSISDVSSFNDSASRASPVRPVQSMVGVLPGEGETSTESGSHPNRDRHERILGTHRSTTSLDARSHHTSSSDAANGYNRSHNSISSGYIPDDDRSSLRANNAMTGSAWSRRPNAEERTSSHRSTTAVDPRAYGAWADSRASGQDRTTARPHTSSRHYSNESVSSAEPEQPATRRTTSRHYSDDSLAGRNAEAEQSTNARHTNSRHYSNESLSAGRSADVEQSSTNSSDRHGRSRRSGRPLRASRTLTVESPAFPVTVEYTDDDHYSRPRGSSNYIAHTVEVPAFTGNALGLELTLGSSINAPTPVFPPAPFLRSWSRDHYES